MRDMTTVTLSRWPWGFRAMRRRPALSVMLVPSTPMNVDTLSTAGSSRIACARRRLRSLMASNEIDCGASEMPWMRPVSCSGKKPLGITR
jgi:hypothetical protein